MAYEMREGQGSLFRNDNKTSDKSPDWSGKLLLDGRMYRLVGWDNKDRNDRDYMSLKGEPADGTRRNDQPMEEQFSDFLLGR